MHMDDRTGKCQRPRANQENIRAPLFLPHSINKREKKGEEENISDELCVCFQAWHSGVAFRVAHNGHTHTGDATGKLPAPGSLAWPVAVTGESRNLIQISAHATQASKLSYRNGSKGSFCPKASAQGMLLVLLGRRDQ